MSRFSESYFLRWWLIALVIAVMAFWGWHQGIFASMFFYDHTKITLITLFVFSLASVMIGINTYTANAENAHELDQEQKLEFGWFAADICMTLGLLGTVVGFIMMMNTDLVSFAAQDPSAITRLISSLTASMGTAFYTTAVGVLTSILLKVQSYNYFIYVNKLKKLSTW